MRFLAIILLSTIPFSLIGQINKPNPKPKPVPNKPVAKTPKVSADIGGIKSGTYPLQMVKNLIDSNLVIKDENGKMYTINRCTFLYKKKMTYKDENTGETKISWEYLGKELRNNQQLDNVWRTTIKEELKKGESLIFEKILANSQKGFLLQVKEITLTVE